jgi:hypothetical protein
MKRGLVIMAACLLVVLTVAAGAAPAKRSAPAKRGDICTWGASSVVVQQVDGKLVQSEPVTTGCIP